MTQKELELKKYIAKANILNQYNYDLVYDKRKDTVYITGINIARLTPVDNDNTYIIEIPDFVTDFKPMKEKKFTNKIKAINYKIKNRNLLYYRSINDFEIFDFIPNYMPNCKIILKWRSFSGRHMYGMFSNINCLSELTLDIPLNTVESMKKAFSYSTIDKLWFKDTHTDNLVNIESIFNGSNINETNFSELNLEHVINMNNAFSKSQVYTSKNELHLNSLRAIKNMDFAFKECVIAKINLKGSSLKNLVTAKSVFMSSLANEIEFDDNTEFDNLEIITKAFENSRIKKIKFNGNSITLNKVESIRNIFAYSLYNNNTLVNGKTGKRLKEVRIPNLKMCSKAFASCNKLEELDLNNLKIEQRETPINTKSFVSGCYKLRSLQVPDLLNKNLVY